jgi:hypothetical protein
MDPFQNNTDLELQRQISIKSVQSVLASRPSVSSTRSLLPQYEAQDILNQEKIEREPGFFEKAYERFNLWILSFIFGTQRERVLGSEAKKAVILALYQFVVLGLLQLELLTLLISYCALQPFLDKRVAFLAVYSFLYILGQATQAKLVLDIVSFFHQRSKTNNLTPHYRPEITAPLRLFRHLYLIWGYSFVSRLCTLT